LAAITLFAAVLRGWHLHHPMRYDEAFTFLAFANSAYPRDWFNYMVPNNHLLHTLLVRLSTALGGNGPVALRMPAFIAGVALVPATAWLGRLLGGRLAGVLAAILVACWSILIEYSVNARGYSMVCLAAVLLAAIGVKLLSDPSRTRLWTWWAITAALGIFTVPVMLYAVALVTLAMAGQAAVFERRKLRPLLGRLSLALVGAGFLSVLLYIPTVLTSGPAGLLAPEHLSPRPLWESLAALGDTVAQTWQHWSRGITGVAVVAALAGSAWLAVRRRQLMLLLPILAVVLLPLAALAQRVVVFPRLWLFVVPWLAVTAGAAVAQVAAIFLARPSRAARLTGGGWAVAPAALALAAGLATLDRSRFMISEEPATLTDAQAIVADLQAASLCDGQTGLVSQLPSWPPLSYYSTIWCQVPLRPGIARHHSRAVIVVGPGQTLESVFEANPEARSRLGAIAPLKQYPRSRTYMAPVLNGHPSPEPQSVPVDRGAGL
jgi:hypothetical protein